LLGIELILGLLVESYSEFVVNKGDDHVIVERNHIGWDMVVHLLHALHEDEGTVGGESIFSSFSDDPAFLWSVSDSAVVSRDGLKFDLNVSLHGSSHRVNEFGAVSVNIDFVLDVVDVLISTDPGRSGSEMWEVFGVNVKIGVRWSHHVEVLRWGLCWWQVMDCLVKVIMDNLTEIHDATLKDLDFCSLIKFDSGGVHESKISDIVLTIDTKDHELRFPKLLVVWNLIVIGFSLTNLEDCSVSFEVDLNILEFFSVNTFELELESLLWDDICSEDHFLSLHDTWGADVVTRHILQSQVSQHFIILEVLHSGVVVVRIRVANGTLVDIDGTFELGLVKLDLVHEAAVAILIK